MKTIAEEMRDLDKVEAQTSQVTQGLAEHKKTLREMYADIRARLKKGETTGDPIKDLVWIIYGSPHDSLEQTYADLLSKMIAHENELVLVLRNYEEDLIKYVIPGSKHFYLVRTAAHLGVLSDTKFVVDAEKESCAFPTGGRYAFGSDVLGDSVTLRKKNLDVGLGWDILFLNQPAQWHEQAFPVFGIAPISQIEIVIGTKLVISWFKQPFSHRLTLLQKMCQALEFPLPEIPELTKQNETRKTALIKEIGTLFAQWTQVKERIDAIYQSIGGVLRSGGGITPVEDEDDARVISMGPRQELREIEGKIEQKLKQARELELDNHPSIQAYLTLLKDKPKP